MSVMRILAPASERKDHGSEVVCLGRRIHSLPVPSLKECAIGPPLIGGKMRRSGTQPGHQRPIYLL